MNFSDFSAMKTKSLFMLIPFLLSSCSGIFGEKLIQFPIGFRLPVILNSGEGEMEQFNAAYTQASNMQPCDVNLQERGAELLANPHSQNGAGFAAFVQNMGKVLRGEVVARTAEELKQVQSTVRAEKNLPHGQKDKVIKPRKTDKVRKTPNAGTRKKKNNTLTDRQKRAKEESGKTVQSPEQKKIKPVERKVTEEKPRKLKHYNKMTPDELRRWYNGERIYED